MCKQGTKSVSVDNVRMIPMQKDNKNLKGVPH